jgi:lipopolysaccharide transport system permease protein
MPSEARVVVVEPGGWWPSLDLGEWWRHRDLLYFLAWRDVRVRYKQTLLGVAWVLLQPAVSLAVMSLVFGRMLKVPTGGVPYPVFAYAALLPWTFFATSVTRAAQSLVANARLVTKVYFPRLLIPVASVLAGVVDLAAALAVLVFLLLAYRVPLGAALLCTPVFLALALAASLAFGLWLAALNVRYRDVSHLVPFLLQLWLYATPVLYGLDLVPRRLQALLGLNPMAGIVLGFRWAVLGGRPGFEPLPLAILAQGAAVTFVLLLGGLVLFRATERTFADVV